MEQATVERVGGGEQERIETPVPERLSDLRSLAKKNAGAAQEETWRWFEQLGRRRAEDQLNQLFALGKAPKGLDGPTDGILVVPLIQGALDRGLSLITRAWMPWNGKRFDANAKRGDNRLTGSSRFPAKLIWPRYGMKPAEDGRLAFEFETRTEAGKHDPDTDVLVIDYEPVEENPSLLIRRIRDELVEVVPGAYLGKILYRTGENEYTNLGFFALRPQR